MLNLKFSDYHTSIQRSIFFALGAVLLLISSFNTSAKASAVDVLTYNSLVYTSETPAFDADTSKVYRVVDKMPKPIGGVQAIYENISYPREAIQSGIEGRVFITFVVDKQGNVQQPRILRDIGGGCGQAAIEAVKKVKFTPGLKGGKPVKVQFSLPVTFKLRH